MVEKLMDGHTLSAQEAPLAPALETSTATESWLIGEHNHRLYVLAPEKIDYVESCGNYVAFVVAGTQYINRNSVKRLAVALADRGFLRIQKSLLINLAAVRYLQRVGKGVFAFSLRSGACLRSGPVYRVEILRALPLANAPRLHGRSSTVGEKSTRSRSGSLAARA